MSKEHSEPMESNSCDSCLTMEEDPSKESGESSDKSLCSFELKQGGNTSSSDGEMSQTVSFHSSRAPPVDQDVNFKRRHDDRYLVKKLSTAVPIESHLALSDGSATATNDGAIRVLSILEGIAVISISLIIKISSELTPAVPKTVEKQYMLTLYTGCLAWMVYYSFVSPFLKSHQIGFSKRFKASNHWLKGVMVSFGLAIVLNDGLHFLSLMIGNSSSCSETNFDSAITFIHSLFILSQVNYILTYSKVYVRRTASGPRFILALIIATNLSSWFGAIIDETVKALLESRQHGIHVEQQENETVAENPSVPDVPSSLVGRNPAESCNCHHPFCHAALAAEKFLFPVLIEFFLVATCLLASVWNNINAKTPACDEVVEPSHKFYHSYWGVALGVLSSFATVITTLLLGTHELASLDHPTYFTETSQTTIYSSFLIGLESCMLAACGVGFYLFHRLRRFTLMPLSLDNVLLVICVFAPLALNLFSVVAVVNGVDNRVHGWELTVLQPLCNVLQCLAQLIFILFGLSRKPVAFETVLKEVASSGRRRLEQIQTLREVNNEADQHGGSDNPAFLDTLDGQSSVTSIAFTGASGKFPTSLIQTCTTSLGSEKGTGEATDPSEYEEDSDEKRSRRTRLPGKGCDNDASEEDGKDVWPRASESSTQQHGMKASRESRVAQLHRHRLCLRNVTMFLIVANACVWMFMSLDGTAYNIYFYQAVFFGGSAWTTILTVCRPLHIFFRLHSIGCLFTMWSDA